MQFASIEEVYSFYDGMVGTGANSNSDKTPLTPVEIAYNVGRYIDAIELISITKEYFDKAQAKEWIKFGCGAELNYMKKIFKNKYIRGKITA